VIRVNDVLAALTVPAVLQWYHVDYTDGPEIRLAECPRCGADVKREGFALNRDAGRWVHHSGPVGADNPCRGDLLALVAAFEQLDRKRDFRTLVERAAAIAGISESTDRAELDARRELYAREREQRAREAAARRAQAVAAVPGRWAGLPQHSDAGADYIRSRGLDLQALRSIGDVVRFNEGDPAVRLHSYDGNAINIVTRYRVPRQINGHTRKMVGRKYCPTDGTLVGKIADLDVAGEGPDVAVLTEGVADTLAGVLAFPGCVVVGASGAARMPDVAAAIASRLVEARGWLLVVPHVDGGTGEDHAAQAVIEAERAGLKLDESIRLVDVRPHKDLCDAWRDGWRWRWP
jgi:hypothetical protein